MSETPADPRSVDLAEGIALESIADGGKLVGHLGAEEILLIRRGAQVFAVAARCTHYHAPLIDGLVVNDTVRCPWHHACFDLHTGEARRPPAFAALAAWSVELRDGRIFVGKRVESPAPDLHLKRSGKSPGRIVIVGGGGAGFAAAEMLRRQGYGGELILLDGDAAAPVDRPNLSKDYLAGSAPEDWVPLCPESFYTEQQIDLRLSTSVTNIDAGSHRVVLGDGSTIHYDRLLLATGAEPVRLPIPGADPSHLHTLRSFADCRTLIERASSARRALIVGASFIGLEVAASLRARGMDVHVVAPGKRPMERILGAELGDLVRALHERHGVIFHLENVVAALDGPRATLRSGAVLDADLVVLGVGVRPRLGLAERAGLAMDRGVAVNAFLETSVPGIYAAGDIARWPDPHSHNRIRVEHWVVAQRQGQTAALNMLGIPTAFDGVPFFWSQHYDVQINYVGHAEDWDELAVEGDIAGRDCLVRYRRAGHTLAAASISRDLENLQLELAMERDTVRS